MASAKKITTLPLPLPLPPPVFKYIIEMNQKEAEELRNLLGARGSDDGLYDVFYVLDDVVLTGIDESSHG